jgi:hypothetical protein
MTWATILQSVHQSKRKASDDSRREAEIPEHRRPETVPSTSGQIHSRASRARYLEARPIPIVCEHRNGHCSVEAC